MRGGITRRPIRSRLGTLRSSQRGTWGGAWHPEFAPKPGDIVAKEHWGASGFANTDLDLLLKQHNVTNVIVIGLLANTCIEGTSRFATELGYRVTLVRDATSAFSADDTHAAHELNGPTFAHEIVTTAELVERLGATQRVTTAQA
jgi:nicotinamidase-related amidase